jgi:hypothetical protein
MTMDRIIMDTVEWTPGHAWNIWKHRERYEEGLSDFPALG